MGVYVVGDAGVFKSLCNRLTHALRKGKPAKEAKDGVASTTVVLHSNLSWIVDQAAAPVVLMTLAMW